LSQKKVAQTEAATEMAAAIFVAEIFMTAASAYTGKKADSTGRKRLFVAAFAFLAFRNGLSVISHDRYYLISLQALEGICEGISGVLITLMCADLAKGTGRFNFLQGAIASSMGLGSLLSNAAFGALAKSWSFNPSFVGLALTAIGGGILFHRQVPETGPAGRS
jgi:MFS family permease